MEQNYSDSVVSGDKHNLRYIKTQFDISKLMNKFGVCLFVFPVPLLCICTDVNHTSYLLLP